MIGLKKFFHLTKFILVSLKHILILSSQLFFDLRSSLYISEFSQKFKGTLTRIQFLFKGLSNQCSSLTLKNLDLLLESLESSEPLRIVVNVVDIILEGFKFTNLLFDSICDCINRFRGASYSFEVISKNSKELFKYNAGYIEIF